MVPTTLMIDRRYRGVGRIKRASGTKVPAMKRRLERMMEALHSEGRLDILRLIRDGKLTILQVHDAYQRKAIDQLPTGETMAPVQVSMGAWIDGLRAPADYSAHHIATMRTTRRYLDQVSPNGTLAALPAMLGSRDLTHRPVWTSDQREVAYPASRPAKEPDRFRFPEVGGWAKWLSNGASDWVTGGTYFVRRGSC